MPEFPELSAKFTYDGTKRIVDNVTIEVETDTLIGMERRKSGKFSNKIKRYSIPKMTGSIIVDRRENLND